MSFGIDTRKLKKLVDLYRPGNQAEEMKYLLILKGEDDLFISKLCFIQICRRVLSRGSLRTLSKTAEISSDETNSKSKSSLL